MGELVFNIWFAVDMVTDLSATAFFKTYCLEGTDKEKLEMLKKFAVRDFITCERFVYTTGLKGNIYGEMVPAVEIPTLFGQNIDFFVQEMERRLPKIYIFSEKGEYRTVRLKFTEPILYNITYLYENEKGLLIPNTTLENKRRIAMERDIINHKILQRGLE